MTPENRLIAHFESSLLNHLNLKLTSKSTLHQAMKYSLLNGGKRIRPLFTLEAAQLVSLNANAALLCAMALEMVHGFSLVHDDLPCMDNDDFRRGQPTTHRKFGEANALLAGDALLNLANRTFSECANMVNPAHFQKAFSLFTESTADMILGQSEELELHDPHLEDLIRIQSLKTGALFKASILCPLLLSGVAETDPLFQECSQYADGFGFAFQIADDLEDDEQDRIQGAKNILSILGRATAVDLARKKLLAPTISSQFTATDLLLNKLQ
jgi:geranylgeranyl diphosphate synthase type II